jgi:transcriptional antiterminator Rof (Rho-off)
MTLKDGVKIWAKNKDTQCRKIKKKNNIARGARRKKKGSCE